MSGINPPLGGVLPLRSRIGVVVRAGLGAFMGLAIVGALADFTELPWLLGSFGATCVLLFGFPESPFAQARNVIGGHLLASLVGLIFLNLFGPGWVPMAAAGACALMVMMLTRTVHPPAGSNPVIIFMSQSDWLFLLLPTLVGASTLMLIAVLYRRTSETFGRQ